MKLQILDLNKFKALYWLYYEQSLLQASQRLNLTSSGVRQSIKALEKSLGIQLFMVSGKTYIPTKEAKEFLELISPFFDQLEEKIETFSNQRRELKGKLSIGSPFVYSYELLTKISHGFTQKYPDVNIQIESGGTSHLLEKVISGELDFAIGYDGPEVITNSKLSFNKVSEDYLVLCYCPKAFRIKKNLPTYESLKSCKHIAYTPSQLMLHRWYKYHFSKSPKLEVDLTVNNVPAIREAVLAGAGLGVLPYSFIESDLKKQRIRFVETKKKKLINNRILIQNADKVPSLLEKTFTNYLLVNSVASKGRNP